MGDTSRSSPAFALLKTSGVAVREDQRQERFFARGGSDVGEAVVWRGPAENGAPPFRWRAEYFDTIGQLDPLDADLPQPVY